MWSMVTLWGFQCGDFNGHIGKNADESEGVHGGRGFGRRNLEGERIVESAVAHNLVVSNSLFTNRERHLVTYQSGENQSQIDYILVKRQNIILVRDVKVITNGECVTQHKLLVCDTRMVKIEVWCKKFVPKRCEWKLQQADLRDKLCETFTDEMKDTAGEHADDTWSRLKQGLLSATEKTCG